MKAQEGKTGQTQTRLSDSERLEQLCEKALKLGATAAAAIPAKDISVDKKFSDMCLKPRCHNYGQSKSCPPHVEGPSAFKKMLENFERAIFFKINVPKEILLSNERLEVFQLLHETASGIENEAVKAGFTEAKAFAGGSCKEIFCSDHYDCNVISKKGECRNPQTARPSMSGFGVDVSILIKNAGWEDSLLFDKDNNKKNETADVYGLILIY